jgi:hypothetical protein
MSDSGSPNTSANGPVKASGIVNTYSLYRGASLSVPIHSRDGSVTIYELGSGNVFYRGPGDKEVFPPSVPIRSCQVSERLHDMLVW